MGTTIEGPAPVMLEIAKSKSYASPPRHQLPLSKQRIRPECHHKCHAQYDFTRSTRDNYGVDAAAGKSYGRFRAIRDMLDKEYHGVYIRARQQLQDDLICQVVDPHKVSQKSPWIVFTAGAMGAGKSRTINWMAERGIFPLKDIVQLDADIFKTALPEWQGYVAHDATSAGTLTRYESGYLVEIAEEVALRLGKHIWVDGSLRDGDWYEKHFKRIRARYPEYEIAILYVTADEQLILERAHKRGRETGRIVPEAEIRDSLRRVPEAVDRLTPFANFVAEIDNSGPTPSLVRYVDSDGSTFRTKDQWQEIQRRFQSVRASPYTWKKRMLRLFLGPEFVNGGCAGRAAA